MKRFSLLFATLLFAAIFALAGTAPMTGTIISENSVACGSKAEHHKQSVQLLCQEYVVRTTTTDYRIRQQKPSDQALIPVNSPIEFKLNKDKMKFKANGKNYEYVVVSETAAGTPKP